MRIDQRCALKGTRQGEAVEHPHALPFNADPVEGSNGRGGGEKGRVKADFVAPGEHFALKSKFGESGCLEMRHDRNGTQVSRPDDDQGALVLMEIPTKGAPEIGPGNKRDGTERDFALKMVPEDKHAAGSADDSAAC